MNKQRVILTDGTHEDGQAILRISVENDYEGEAMLTAADATVLASRLLDWLESHDECTKPRYRMTDIVEVVPDDVA